ncbi:MAG TPA: hypothetical protein VG100_10340 [Xanthobacteraceae bacterium]|nr:hypothetical protein [Xanthobacteraceae bacterium]
MGRLLRLGHRRSGLLRRRGLRMGRLRDRRPLLRGRRFLLRLGRLLLLRLLLLLREQHRAVLAGARRDRLAQRKTRENRSGEQQLLRSGHIWPSFRSLGKFDSGAGEP